MVVTIETTIEAAMRRYLETCVDTTGPLVALCLGVNSPAGDSLAANYAAQGLRAARMLGHYTED